LKRKKKEGFIGFIGSRAMHMEVLARLITVMDIPMEGG
jgi:hypothetical protein